MDGAYPKHDVRVERQQRSETDNGMVEKRYDEVFCVQKRYDEAEKMQLEVLAVRKRVLGAEHPDTLTATGNLAASIKSQEKYDEAVAMDREVLAVQQRVLGADHPDTLSTVGDLAASPAGRGSVDDIQGGSITSELEKPGIGIASTSAAEPASKRARKSNNRAPEGRSIGAEGEQGGGGGGGGGGGRGGGAGGGDGAAGALWEEKDLGCAMNGCAMNKIHSAVHSLSLPLSPCLVWRDRIAVFR